MARHKVPTHLSVPDGISKFSYRQIVLIGGSLLFVVPPVWHALPTDGPAFGDLVRLLYPRLAFAFPLGSFPVVPILVTALVWAPFIAAALPLDPPLEHGLIVILQWAVRLRGHRAVGRVATDLGRILVKGERIEHDNGISAVWEPPTVNLRLGSKEDVETSEDHYGEFLTGLTTPIQLLVRATPVDPSPMVNAIAAYAPNRNTYAATGKARPHGSAGATPQANARKLATWLRQVMVTDGLIERRHFIAICAPDEQEFADSVDEINSALGDLGFRSDQVKRLAGAEAASVVQGTWSVRSDPKRVQLGPVQRVFNAVGAWLADDCWNIVLAWGKWPRLMPDNALAPLIDGPYETDVAMFIEPVDVDSVTGKLERRSEAMKATEQIGTHWRKRKVAIEDLDDFTLALESGEQSAFDVAIYCHVRGHGTRAKKLAEQQATRVSKRIKRSGGAAKALPWEQAAAVASMAPLGVNRLDRRSKRVNTDPLKNLYPLTASMLWMDGAVPLGETLDSRRPVGLNCFRQPVLPNPQMAVYSVSGGGKGFLIKVLLSRELFAKLVQEIFGFDQAAEDPLLGEYGRFAQYCGLEYRHVASKADFEDALADLDNYRWLGPGIIWNIAKLPLADRPQFVATVVDKLWERSVRLPANRKLVFDELWKIVGESKDAPMEWLARCLACIEKVVREGRHIHLGGVYMTQRVKDALDLPVMQVIQDQATIQCFGQQNPSHINAVAESLEWTEAVKAQIRKLRSGQFVLSAGPWMVAMRVHASDDEYAMANTDNVVQREEAAA